MHGRERHREAFIELSTPRLLLRPWRRSDLDALAAMTSDPRVMADLPATLSRPELEALAARNRDHFVRHGFGLWAIERSEDGACLGFAGLWRISTSTRPLVEIGWRLAFPHWGHGYATETGCAILGFAFGSVRLGEVVGFTAVGNYRSQRVMEKLGMRLDMGAAYPHPALPADHPLHRQLTYKIDPAAWIDHATSLRPAS